MKLELTQADIQEKKIFMGKGCDNCRNIGYKGRLGIYEIMTINDEIRRLINEQANSGVIKTAAEKNGMNTLRKSGLTAIFNGLTTIDEVIRETIAE
jgi:type IV pilus assembly protein PilB